MTGPWSGWQRVVVSTALALAAMYLAYGIWGSRASAVLAFMVRFSTPLALAAMCAILGERSGVVNVAIEGQMLLGAFVGFFAAVAFGIVAGVLMAVVVGALLGALLALCAVTWRIDQIIAGMVLNILAVGVTSYFYRQGKTLGATMPTWEVPLLADLPLLGPVFFRSHPLTYLTFVIIGVVQVALFRTAWGLRTRAVGEHPTAAATVGVDVARYRYANVALGGGLAGLAGALLSLEVSGSFERGMTEGRGFLALAIVIVGRWRPLAAGAVALFFGVLSGLVNQLDLDKVIDVPPQFTAMFPYVLTIAALAVFANRMRPPASSGKPYTGV